MCMYKCGWGKPTWKVFKGYNAKIQAQIVRGKGGQTGGKRIWNVIWKENLISLTMFLMLSQTM
jgi:hypothetical protein